MIDVQLNGSNHKLSISGRLDIIIKYLYALNKLSKLPEFINVDVDELYHKHLHIRTGSKEPGDEIRKSNINCFIKIFDSLIESMQSGFDYHYPVPISSLNNLPLNGAHRLAASLATGLKPSVVMSSENIGGSWNASWFLRSGFSKNELYNVVKSFTYSQNHEDMYLLILWEPSSIHWEDIRDDLCTNFNFVHEEIVELERGGFNEFIRDVYSFDWGPKVGENIERKINLLKNIDSRFKYFVLESKIPLTLISIKNIKNQIRERYKKTCPIDNFTTLHISENKDEFKHLEDILLNEKNMKILNTRKSLDNEFIDLLCKYRNKLKELGIHKNQCCVVGSSVLNALSLRKADDIDFTLLHDIRMKKFDNGVTKMDEIDVVSYNYPRTFSLIKNKITDNQLIKNPKNHFFLRGFKFADPKIILTRKQHQRREKDIRDINLLGEYLWSHSDT
jgi:hypothetical protein